KPPEKRSGRSQTVVGSVPRQSRSLTQIEELVSPRLPPLFSAYAWTAAAKRSMYGKPPNGAAPALIPPAAPRSLVALPCRHAPADTSIVLPARTSTSEPTPEAKNEPPFVNSGAVEPCGFSSGLSLTQRPLKSTCALESTVIPSPVSS